MCSSFEVADNSKEVTTFPKRLHHPKHNSVRKSSSISSSMWIPLSATPEPVERCQTRILDRSTDGLNIPSVESDSEECSKQTADSMLYVMSHLH